MSYENICNICGANYEYVNGRWVCPACGAYKAEELSNEEVTLLYNAAQKLRLADFDDAEQAYADIVQKYPFNHEGYWGRLLSKYGIKYEEDFDGKKIPTCYATTIESILGDSDYKRATELAPPDVREYYARQAEYIERVRKEWVEKASHEAPYDVFICYKDSDLANGIDRTQDSIAAQELYIHLMEQGYRVFFSRESLRDKVGEKYEPYIFNALSTAKVMLVYGTNPEFITSTWLKNEWTRYHKRILAGDKKQGSLVTICDGFAPSELPRLLSATQCFDATKRSFYSDLDKYVKKYTKEDEPAPVVVPAPEGEAAGDAAVQEAPAAVEKKKLSRGKKTAIGVAAAAVLIAVLMVIFIPILTADPALDNFEIREGAGGMTYISGYVGDGKKVVIPEKFNGGTVVGIEARAFDSMDTLTSITIPDSVTSIGANAFYGCTSVDTIVIPSSVTSMGMSAFYGWTNKQTVIIQGKDTAPSGWNAKWLEGCDAKIVYSKITVEFDANGGRGKATNIKSEIDSKITLPDGKDFTRAGYTFAGWTLDEKGTKADFKAGEVYNTGKDQGLIFYAVWSPNKNKIIFDANGGKGSMNPIEGYTDSRVELPTATFTRDGYNFIGWATASGASSPKYSAGAYYTFGTANSTVLYAVWEAMPRNIYLYPNGGVGDVQTYYDMYVGHMLFLDKGYFTRQGYTFAGYAESPDGPLMYPKGSDYTVPDGQGDIMLYAFWEPRNYSIRFHSNDENGKTVTVQVGFETTIDLPDPGFSREGYKLIGWSTNNKVENMTVEYEVNGKYTHKNMGTFSLYAVWAPMEYNVTFQANHPNAGGVMNSIQIALGSEAKLPACTFIYDGHMLAGWATAPDGEAVYDPEGLFKMTTMGDKVLYAVWKEMEYSIRYELGNHGVNHFENPAVYRKSDGTVTLKAPTCEGYEFLGWFSDAEMKVACDTIESGSTGERVFYAKWHALPNTVNFNANGGTGSMNSVTADTDTVITLPLNTMTREDCTFMGWTTVLGGTEVEYADGAEFTMQSHGVTLYAVWKAQSYTISYDFAGGELPGAVTEYSHLTNSFTLGVPTREGYEFVGWSGTGIEGIQRTVMIPTGSKGERSYTANWQAKTHTIVFERYETYVEGTMNELSAKTGETIVLTANCFVNQGYVFKGWATEPNGAVTYTDGQTITMGPVSMTLYPVWELKTPGLVFEGHYVTGYTGSSTEVIVPTYYQGIRIQYIREGAFRDKTHITSISLPKYISWIGENAFAGCTSLSKIDFAGQANRVSLSAFLNTAYYNDPANRVNGVFYFEGHLIAPIDLTISGNYVIPSGTKVIAAEAFKNCANLVTIFIPSSVKYVGANAFQNCSSLTIRYEDAEISTKWESSWNSSNCPVVFNYYEEYTDTNGVKYNLYPDGSAIVTGYTGTTTDLTLSLDGYTVKKIADGAFQNNGTLTKVTFVSGLVEIGANAFSGCYNLVEIVLPEGLEKIGENAFNECQRLTTITATGEASQILRASTVTPIKNFPSTLKQIGFRAFYGCNSLKVVFIPSTLQELRSDAFYGYENLIVYAQPTQQPQGWEWLNVTIKWGVDGVYCDAQEVVYALYADKTAKVMDYFGTATTVTIALDGYTVIGIDERAFYDCDALKTVTLPSTLKTLGEYAFAECRALERIEIPEGITEIANYAFGWCNAMTEAVLPSTVTKIGEHAFAYCNTLSKLNLPVGLLEIGANAFAGCHALESVFLPASIEKMGEQVFIDCGSLMIYASVAAQPGAWNLNWNKKGWDNSFHTLIWNYKTHLTADNGVTYIITNDNKAYVVSYKGTATELDLTLDGYNVVEIESYAFDGCTTLQKIVLPEGLVKIGAYAFNGCTALVDIKLPSTLTTICDH
ncbi:MAG: leucine-rich repeat protein, partial [Clostridia bacterium]|nr:leucine-rich repeat protein [Clostridia bacterium]